MPMDCNIFSQQAVLEFNHDRVSLLDYNAWPGCPPVDSDRQIVALLLITNAVLLSASSASWYSLLGRTVLQISFPDCCFFTNNDRCLAICFVSDFTCAHIRGRHINEVPCLSHLFFI